MRTATKVSLALCTSMYFLVSLFGYLLFGDAVQGDVLANFDIDLGVPYSGVSRGEEKGEGRAVCIV